MLRSRPRACVSAVQRWRLGVVFAHRVEPRSATTWRVRAWRVAWILEVNTGVIAVHVVFGVSCSGRLEGGVPAWAAPAVKAARL